MIASSVYAYYIEAIKDIRAVLLGPYPANLVGLLAKDGTTTLLRRWALSDPPKWAILSADFQHILHSLDKAIEDFPADPWLRIMRGRASIAVGYHAAALQDFQIAYLRGASEVAFLYLFTALAYFSLTAVTMDDPLGYYSFASYNATKAIGLYLSQGHRDVRAYLIRAECDAHIVKLGGHHRSSLYFAKKCHDIEVDIAEARKLSDETEQTAVEQVEQNIKSFLDL